MLGLICGCQHNGNNYGNDSIVIQAISGVDNLRQFSIRDAAIEIVNDGTGNGAPFDLEMTISCGGNEIALTAQPIECEPLSAGGAVSVIQRVIIPKEALGASVMKARAERNGTLLSEKTFSCTVDAIPSESEPNDSRFANANALLLNQGYAAFSSSPADEDWLTLTLTAGAGAGMTADGKSGPVQIEVYVGTAGTPAVSFTDDGFSGGRTITNNTTAAVTVYLNVTSATVQEYVLILERLDE